MNKRLTLVLGGTRAGKSNYAQRLAARGERVLFLATAEAGDEEMEARIVAHREARPTDWDTLEEPVDLAAVIAPRLHRYDTVLLDCLTLWVSNLLLRGFDPATARRDILPAARGCWLCTVAVMLRGSSSATRWGSASCPTPSWAASMPTSLDASTSL